jgi:hypothetical protein
MIPAPEPAPAPPLPPGQLATADAAVPPLHPGVYPDLTIAQQVTSTDAILASVTASTVTLTVVDPGVAPLPADEILAVYPPAGAEDAADVMLPHVALRARSLPWANPPLPGATTWLALLLLRKGEATFNADGPPTVTCTQGQLTTLLPTKQELGLLCHVRELPSDDPLAARDDDRFVAIVVGNRLPVANLEHDACLVDLRGLGAAPIWPGNPVNNPTKQALPLLHRWSFKTGSGGDFEAHFARLRCPEPPDNPTGGVLAFGQSVDGEALADDDGALLLAAPLPDEPDRRVRYAGPLVPLARVLEQDPSDSADAALGLDPGDGSEVVGLAAAFELGRLLAIANPRVLAGLVGFRDHQLRKDIETILETEALPRPGMPGFVSDWRDIFDDPDPWFDGVRDDLWKRSGDPTGILGLVGKVPGLDTTRLDDLGGFQLERRLATMPGPLAAPGPAVTAAPAPALIGLDLAAPDLATILDNQFGALRASVAAIGLDLDEELAP